MVSVGFFSVAVGERRSVDDEEVLHLVHLVERVQRRALRIGAHAAGAVLVDRRAVASSSPRL